MNTHRCSCPRLRSTWPNRVRNGYAVDADVRFIKVRNGYAVDADVRFIKVRNGCAVDADVRFIKVRNGCAVDAGVRFIKVRNRCAGETPTCGSSRCATVHFDEADSSITAIRLQNPAS